MAIDSLQNTMERGLGKITESIDNNSYYLASIKNNSDNQLNLIADIKNNPAVSAYYSMSTTEYSKGTEDI